MNLSYVSPFDIRQVMKQDDFEIFHRIDTASGFITPHSHDFYELYLPRTEGVTYIVEGRRYKLNPGMLMLVAPKQTHHSTVSETGLAVDRFVLWLEPHFVESLIALLPRIRNLSPEVLKGRNLIVPDPETFDLIIGLMFSLLREKRLNDMDSATLNRLGIAQLLVHVSRALSNDSAGMTGREAQRYRDVMRVYEYISAHLMEPLSVSDLAERFFMDKNTLTRQFKRATGMTPAECIRRKRLDAAYTMIIHGAGVIESCHECGFSDYSAFYRAFRQAYGVSPSGCAAQPHSGVQLHTQD